MCRSFVVIFPALSIGICIGSIFGIIYIVAFEKSGIGYYFGIIGDEILWCLLVFLILTFAYFLIIDNACRVTFGNTLGSLFRYPCIVSFRVFVIPFGFMSLFTLGCSPISRFG